MAQQRPMSTPIFDELLREFSIRMEEQRGIPDQPEQAAQVPAPTGPPASQPSQAAAHRHRAD